jgi:hypothetical protein
MGYTRARAGTNTVLREHKPTLSGIVRDQPGQLSTGSKVPVIVIPMDE